MRIIKKNVYYCEFCRKKSLRSLKNHELHCTGNPERECGLCEVAGIANDTKEIIEKIKAEILATKPEEIIDQTRDNRLIGYIVNYSIFQEIERKIDWCPACYLSILRQCKIKKFISKTLINKASLECDNLSHKMPEDDFIYTYDFKKDMNMYWAEINANRQPEY